MTPRVPWITGRVVNPAIVAPSPWTAVTRHVLAVTGRLAHPAGAVNSQRRRPGRGADRRPCPSIGRSASRARTRYHRRGGAPTMTPDERDAYLSQPRNAI